MDMICVRCNRIVDHTGKDPAACHCTCRWPNGGCGERIYMIVNLGENRQPFNLDGSAHHAICRAYIQEKEAATTCPACSSKRPRNKACPRCGWSPEGRPPQFHVPTIERFGPFGGGGEDRP